MTNEEIKSKLESIEKLTNDNYHHLNEKLLKLIAVQEFNQIRYDVFEEHLVEIKEGTEELLKLITIIG